MNLWRFSLRYLTRNIWQTIMLVIGIALGVAVVIAIDFSNASSKIALILSTHSLVGAETHQLLAENGGIDETLFARLKIEGVLEKGAPVVEGYVTVPDFNQSAMLLFGIDPLEDFSVRNFYGNNSTLKPGLLNTISTAGQVVISKTMATQFHVTLGDLIPIIYEGRKSEIQVAGFIDNEDPIIKESLNGLIIADISTAQEILNKVMQLDRVDLILSTPNEVNQLKAELPNDIYIFKSNQQSDQVAQMVSAFQLNLTALSLLALVVGLFLIYNTMTFSVIQRRELIGIYRSFGFFKSEIFKMIIIEASIIALFGTVLGIVFGILLGRQTVGLITQTINDLYFVTTVQNARLPVISIYKGIILGIFATIVVSIPPALEATRVAPHTATIRSSLEQKTLFSIQRVFILAILMIILAVFFLFSPLFKNLWWAFLATFLIVVSFSLITAGVLNLILPVVAKSMKIVFGIIAGMAVRQLHRSLSRTAIAISSLMVAISITMGMTIMIESFRSTVDIWLKETLVGNIYISVPNQFTNQSNAQIDTNVLESILNNPQIASWNSLATVSQITPKGNIQMNVITNKNIANERLFIKLDMAKPLVWDALQNGNILMSEPLANRLKLKVGDSLELTSKNETVPLKIAGIFYDYASNQGHLLIARDFYIKYWGDPGVTAVSLDVRPGVNIPFVVNELIQQNQSQGQKLVIRDNKTLQLDALSVFDRTFQVTNALRFVATIVSIIGIVIAVMLIIIDRRKEFGILKAIGLNGKEMWQLILTETGLMGLFAGIFAVPTGYIISLILVYVINLRSFGWTIQFHFEWLYVLQAIIIAWISSIIAGIFPIVKINKMQIIEVLRNE